MSTILESTTEKENSMRTLTSLLAEHNVTLEILGDGHNPDPGWGQPVNSYRVRLRMNGRRMDLDFYQGLAIQDPPTVADVMSCLVSDATGIENAQDFDDWSREYGFDLDNVEELAAYRRTYRKCQRQTERLRRFLADAYVEIVWSDNNV